jgi:aquaporin Z
MSISNRAAAEFFGTFWLVLGGCGTAVLDTAVPFGVGHLGVALAFGLTVLTGVYALGHISGGHFNPAISVGLVVGKRFAAKDLLPYIIAQVGGAVTAAAVLFVIARGIPTFNTAAGFASNGYAEHSPSGYPLLSALVCEVVMTFMFVMVVLGTTDARAPKGFAGLVTNTSVNPARSTGPALFVGGWALSQLWLFWVAPLIGGAIAGFVYPAVVGPERPS